MNGEAMKPFSRKCINKDLSFMFFSQNKAKLGNSRTLFKVAFFILMFKSKFHCLNIMMRLLSVLKLLKVCRGIVFLRF